MTCPVSEGEAEVFVGLLHTLLRELTTGSNDPAIGLPLAQLRVCRALLDGPQSISAVGRELCVSPSAVTQIADRLERARLVRRVAEGGDRRVRRLQLTERCRHMMRRHDEERVRRMADALRELSPESRKKIAGAMKTLGRAAAAARSKNGSSLSKAKEVKVLL